MDSEYLQNELYRSRAPTPLVLINHFNPGRITNKTNAD